MTQLLISSLSWAPGAESLCEQSEGW